MAVSLTVTAQQTVNMKIGKPTEEELQMTTYAPDSSAEAVVLCRLTTVEYIIQENGRAFIARILHERMDYKRHF